MKLVPVILAGGGGTRLWPMSRELYPKQFLTLAGEESMLQQTLRRLDGVGAQDTELQPAVVICNEEHRFLVAEQARRVSARLDSIVLEPAGRNTAPALTAAALRVEDAAGDSVLLMMPADHIMHDRAAFHAAVRQGLEAAAAGALVTFGVTADRPETGYGYIRCGNGDADGARPVAGFVEKPDRETAERYLASGEYVWNSGIFMMKASVWLEAIGTFRPDILAACREAVEKGRGDQDFFRLDAEAFKTCPSDSVDYAVMERIVGTPGFEARVVTLKAGWSDVGSWASLWDLSERDADGNALQGDVVALDSRGNLIVAEHRFVAALGCDDLVVVETPDAVLIARRDRSQDVKKIVEWLQQNGRTERITHRRVYRPWGSYEGVDQGTRFQVKRIVVNPGASLSLQMHHHRAEHWIVVNGTAKVTRGDEEFLLCENQSTYIPLGVRHRLSNPGTIPLELIEVQSGPYLGEDDIVRFEDVYNRHR